MCHFTFSNECLITFNTSKEKLISATDYSCTELGISILAYV